MLTRTAGRAAGWAAAATLLLAEAPAARADAEVVLDDGRVLAGDDLRRRGTDYELVLASGAVVALPTELVRELRLGGAAAPADVPEPAPADPRGRARSTSLGFRLPTRGEQLAVFGEPAAFRRGVVDSRWSPRSDWALDPVQNQFHPVRWRGSPIDPTWTPTSGFPVGDVLAQRRVRWRPNVVDTRWHPVDGFSRPGLLTSSVRRSR